MKRLWRHPLIWAVLIAPAVWLAVVGNYALLIVVGGSGALSLLGRLTNVAALHLPQSHRSEIRDEAVQVEGLPPRAPLWRGWPLFVVLAGVIAAGVVGIFRFVRTGDVFTGVVIPPAFGVALGFVREFVVIVRRRRREERAWRPGQVGDDIVARWRVRTAIVAGHAVDRSDQTLARSTLLQTRWSTARLLGTLAAVGVGIASAVLALVVLPTSAGRSTYSLIVCIVAATSAGPLIHQREQRRWERSYLDADAINTEDSQDAIRLQPYRGWQ